jgi:hypothetical protein
MNRILCITLGFCGTFACGYSVDECNKDSDCEMGICDGGECLFLKICSDESVCEAGQICNQELCLLPTQCVWDQHCWVEESCHEGWCVGSRCVGDEDCPSAQRCVLGRCERIPCSPGEDCPEGLACDPLDGACKEHIQQVERCNEEDDDLDGEVDEGFGVGTPCTVGQGACFASGEIVCDLLVELPRCSVSPALPTAEQCNGIDDNCNYAIDEIFDIGVLCVEYVGLCPALGARVCADDGQSTQCDFVPPTPVNEACNGQDDDCDGQIDNGFPIGEACMVGTWPCEYHGWYQCTDDHLDVTCEPGIEPYPYPPGC